MSARAESGADGVRLGSRESFPDLVPRAYLAHAAFSPASELVRRAIEGVLGAVATRGLGALDVLLSTAEDARRRFATLIGAEPSDVAALANTSSTAIAVATAIPWRAGERIALFRDDFPANVTPWTAAAERHGLEVVWLESAPFLRGGDEGLAAVRAALAGRPLRLLALSAVAFQSGLALPVAEIARLAREHGAEVFVDAIQAVGARPLDVRTLGAHYVGAGAYKWLMGVLGTAFLWVDPAASERLAPQLVGWLSHEEPDAFLRGDASALRPGRPLVRGARVFEAGTLNHLGLAAAAAAMEPLIALTPAAIHAHVQRYHDELEPRAVALGLRSLRTRDPAARSALLAFEPPAGIDAARLVAALAARGIVANAPCGNLRFSPHWPNALGEIAEVEDALSAALAEQRA